MQREQEDEATWVRGGKEDDNQRYRDFLKYFEEKREERKRELEIDRSSKEDAQRKENHWKLLRACSETMKENEIKWTTRKIKECERIKEKEKRDRLAIAKEKKRRYGLNRLNKEENQKLKMRTEERLELSQARTNYWRWYREKGKGALEGGKEPGREDTMWINLREEISALEG